MIKGIYPCPNPLQVGALVDFFGSLTFQCRTIPCMLTGQQMLVETPTGTGKTASYLIPAVQLTLNAKTKNNGFLFLEFLVLRL